MGDIDTPVGHIQFDIRGLPHSISAVQIHHTDFLRIHHHSHIDALTKRPQEFDQYPTSLGPVTNSAGHPIHCILDTNLHASLLT